MDCTLTQNGENVSGTCNSSVAPKPVAMSGKVTDKQVTLQHKAEYNGDELTIVYTAKLEKADEFSGTVDVQPMNVDGEFTAKAVK
jgi:hypothetical protein